ncbi:uncharacterized protein AMSG_10459 [Thecamonas trahens ATCC 50062]|uniref:Uncharacterized protein n=1 Tax=Thecamonas trahens ATCC 50062 TaxID=461836 RepID=A0A0L0DQ82_THETB|nr:hypothetical protein AMSG_10459 [Thecamonas trahens ATCC 50062]KNC54462.1 hypothetical protein AMSG_10459 [Thecamonas trahens ATCC 50062]|eukprot:XP_013753617.1 hypothetical protein AMSG_10459 [Thecamonas trahens ATCC 50062]
MGMGMEAEKDGGVEEAGQNAGGRHVPDGEQVTGDGVVAGGEDDDDGAVDEADNNGNEADSNNALVDDADDGGVTQLAGNDPAQDAHPVHEQDQGGQDAEGGPEAGTNAVGGETEAVVGPRVVRMLPPDSASQRKLREKNAALRKRLGRKYSKVFEKAHKEIDGASGEVDKSRSLVDDVARDFKSLNADLNILAVTAEGLFPGAASPYFPSLNLPAATPSS